MKVRKLETPQNLKSFESFNNKNFKKILWEYTKSSRKKHLENHSRNYEDNAKI
jgi:hypothetical protein